jgi:hypothetical protein
MTAEPNRDWKRWPVALGRPFRGALALSAPAAVIDRGY